MDEIKIFFEAYTKNQNYAPDTPEGAKLKEMMMELLTDMLPRKEYSEIEEMLNLYLTKLEETAFMNGFKTAVKVITTSMTM